MKNFCRPGLLRLSCLVWVVAVAGPLGVVPDAKGETAAAQQGFQLSGFFDVYYAQNSNQPLPLTALSSTSPQTTMAPSPQNGLHFYDWYAGQLGLNLVEVTFKHQGPSTAFLLDLDFGQMADFNAQAPSTAASGGPVAGTVDEVSKHIGQAVLSYTPEWASGLTFDIGKMPTHVGLEAIKSKDNWNYTRGALFCFGGPFWHTGLRVGYAIVPKTFSASLYAYQGWNTIYETNAAPTLGAQLKWTPSDSVTWAYNFIGGPEQPRNTSHFKQVHETNVTWTASESLSLAIDALAGYERNVTLSDGSVGDAAWFGAAVLAKFAFHPRATLSPRFEFYRDVHGYTLGGVSQALVTSTLTQAFRVTDGLETRLEVRYDWSTSDTRFMTGAGTPSRSQWVGLLALNYTI